MPNLIYGKVYHILNGYNQWKGGFLDTRGSGCEGNFLCVSTAAGFDRDSGSGSWQILSATGKADGEAVQANDLIHLLNQHGGNGGYLDTRGSGCEGNLLCVSTAESAERGAGTGTWRIFVDTTANEVDEQQTVHLLNGHNDFAGGFLDTRDSGCEGNLYCVSTTCGWNRDSSGTTLWRFFSHHDKVLAKNYESA